MPEGTIINGQIMMMEAGRLVPTPPTLVWSEWFWLADSPYPSSQKRAATLRTALNEIGYPAQ